MTEAAEVDRQAWAVLVMALIKSEAGGNQTRFAAKVGVNPRTVNRWLERAVTVKPESVTEAARALGRNPVELLLRVGYLSPDEAGQSQGAAPLDPDVRRWLAIMADPDVPDENKELMLQQMRLWNQQLRRDAEQERPPRDRERQTRVAS